jgi:hypothetical protein
MAGISISQSVRTALLSTEFRVRESPYLAENLSMKSGARASQHGRAPGLFLGWFFSALMDLKVRKRSGQVRMRYPAKQGRVRP